MESFHMKKQQTVIVSPVKKQESKITSRFGTWAKSNFVNRRKYVIMMS